MTRRAAARRDGAPPKLLTDNGDLPSTLVGGGCFVCSPACPGEGVRRAPGCLTGESEERETWTAESLRAAGVEVASLRERTGISLPCGWTRLRRYTFQVNTIVSRRRRTQRRRQVAEAGVRARKFRWDLVKRCDQPEQDLIQLESLILAQSERWRQA